MTRTKCQNCGANRGLAVYEDGSYCHACQKKEFSKSLVHKKNERINKFKYEKVEGEWTEEAKQYLKNYYITDKQIKELEIYYNPSVNRIIFPINALACWGRSINPEVKLKSMFYGNKTEDCYFIKNLENDESLVLVEDIVSCIRVSEFNSCLSLCGTHVKNDKQLQLTMKYKKLILWLDGDIAGIKGAEKIKRDFKLYKDIKIISTKKDPKEFSPKELKDIYDRAQYS